MKNLFFKFFLLSGLSLLTTELNAQRPRPRTIDMTVDTSTARKTYGPNRRNYFYYEIGLSSITGPMDAGAETNWWSSSISYGFRYKRKLWSWDAFVFGFNYRYDRFSINQRHDKLLPIDPLRHQRERISIHNLSGSFCNRINFGRRGNIMGKWLEFGAYADWVFGSANVYLDQYYDSNSQAQHYRRKTRVTKLDYINRSNYGPVVRFGGNRFGVSAQWRLSRLVTYPPIDIATPDLPRLMIGIEFYPPN